MQNLTRRLDGITIFRFALIRKDQGGGIEEHLKNANRLLLERHRMTIIQTYIDYSDDLVSVSEETIGRGKLIWVPLKRPKIQRPWQPDDIFIMLDLWPWKTNSNFTRRLLRFISGIMGRLPLSKKKIFHLLDKEAGVEVTRIFEHCAFNLAVIHFFHYLDDADIIGRLIGCGVPFAVIHHFENERLLNPIIRLKLRNAKAVGVVSEIGVPKYLRKRTMQIREGIDTNFYQLDKASPITCCNDKKIIFLPARISRSKGQLDLIEALHLLNLQGIKLKVVLAGRVDDEIVVKELMSSISRLNDPEQVIVLGDIDQVTLRNWYAKSDLVVLPTYSEGLGRTLLEAQAMKRPVISYKVGGVPSAMRDGETGFLVRKGDIHGLVERIKELLQNEQLRLKMGETGCRFIEDNFSLIKLVASHEAFYLSALNGLLPK